MDASKLSKTEDLHLWECYNFELTGKKLDAYAEHILRSRCASFCRSVRSVGEDWMVEKKDILQAIRSHPLFGGESGKEWEFFTS